MQSKNFTKFVFGTTFVLIFILLIATLIYRWEQEKKILVLVNNEDASVNMGIEKAIGEENDPRQWDLMREKVIYWTIQSVTIQQKLNREFLEEKYGLIHWIEKQEQELLNPTKELIEEVSILQLFGEQRESQLVWLEILTFQEEWYREMIAYFKTESDGHLEKASINKKEWIDQIISMLDLSSEKDWIKNGHIRFLKNYHIELTQIYETENLTAYILY